MNSNDNVGIKKEKSFKARTPLLITLGIIIVLLVLIGVLKLLRNQSNSQNIYYKMIDEFGEALITTIDKTDEEIKEVFGSDYEITANLKSNDTEISNIANIINNLKLTGSYEFDKDSKKIITNLDLYYKNGLSFSGKALLNDNKLYLDLGNLYNKVISVVPETDLDSLWNSAFDKDVYNTIIKEYLNILKDSLKDEYFTKTEEKINILGKDTSVYNHTLKLNSEQIYELEKTILNKTLDNDKLLTSLADFSNTNKEDLKDSINDALNNLEIPDVIFESSIYVNKSNNDLEKVIVKIGNSGADVNVVLEKTSVDTYDINIANEKIGSLTITDDYYKINIDYQEIKINITINDGFIIDADLSSIIPGLKINLDVSENDDNYKLNGRLIMTEPNIDLTLNVLAKNKDINKISDFNISNSIDINSLSEEDEQTIMNNLLANEAIYNLISDIQEIISSQNENILEY